MNPAGNQASLIPQQPRNTNAVRHGVFSPRTLEPRAREIAEGLMAAGHSTPLDLLAAEEIGALIALIEAADRDFCEEGSDEER